MCVRKGNATNAWALNNGFQTKLEYQTHQQLQCRSIKYYTMAQTPKDGNGLLFHFRPIHRVHIGETTKSRDQLATQISTNLLRGRNRSDIRKTMKGIRMFRTTYLPIVTILDSFMYFLSHFFVSKAPYLKSVASSKPPFFVIFIGTVLQCQNPEISARGCYPLAIRHLRPKRSGDYDPTNATCQVLSNGWLSCFILTVSYPKNSW